MFRIFTVIVPSSPTVRMYLLKAYRKNGKMSVRISLILEASVMLLSHHMLFSLDRDVIADNP